MSEDDTDISVSEDEVEEGFYSDSRDDNSLPSLMVSRFIDESSDEDYDYSEDESSDEEDSSEEHDLSAQECFAQPKRNTKKKMKYC